MASNPLSGTRSKFGYLAWSIAVLAFVLSAGTQHLQAQNFTSGSDGSDGALDLTGQTGTVYFQPKNFTKGSMDNLAVYNFTYITIPSGVTLEISAGYINSPVYFLSQGDVNIAGTIDLSGAPGYPISGTSQARVPSIPGAGGYPGGVGGNTNGFDAVVGGGPGGGGAAGVNRAGAGILVGTNASLVPLVGGSGGGGGWFATSSAIGPGGGAGGGAILIASSTQIIVAGTIGANGGDCGVNPGYLPAGGGAGGAIRLVSNTITGNGSLNAYGGSQNCQNSGGQGIVRREAFTDTFNGPVSATFYQDVPAPLFLPTSGPASIIVTSINGTTINENPFSFPDLNINTGSSVPVVITANNIPVGTVPTLYVFSETGDQTLPCTGGLQGTLATSTCTVNLTFPNGATRGFVKATWTQ